MTRAGGEIATLLGAAVLETSADTAVARFRGNVYMFAAVLDLLALQHNRRCLCHLLTVMWDSGLEVSIAARLMHVVHAHAEHGELRACEWSGGLFAVLRA